MSLVSCRTIRNTFQLLYESKWGVYRVISRSETLLLAPCQVPNRKILGQSDQLLYRVNFARRASLPSSRSGRSSANIIYKLFNSALEDVLTKGGQSKYYNAFKELNPEVGLYNAGSDDIDTLISTREYTNTPEYQAMTQQNRPNLAQKPSIKSMKFIRKP